MKYLLRLKNQLLLVPMVLIGACLFGRNVDVTKLGAKGDGKTLNTASIQKAIDECATTGGGTVVVPAGVYITGTLKLRSNVELHLAHGSVLKGSSRLADYATYEVTGYGTNHLGVLYTENAHNVAISGSGTIDGNDTVFFDWSKAKVLEWGGTKFSRQKDGFRKVSSGIGDGPVVPFDRPRQMVIFSNCTDVSVTGVSLIRSPFWTLHFADCTGVKVDGLRVYSSLLVPNADGVDFTSCSNVTMSNCDIQTGDDAIAICGYAHHYELPGFKNMRHPSGNIVITNCNLQSASSAIRIGWMDQNDISNIQISNINITNSTRGINIALRDEGSISNINISNVHIDSKFRTGDWWGNGEPIQVSAIRGREGIKMGTISQITFENITCVGENGILVYGSAESAIEKLTMKDVSLTLKDGPNSATSGGNIDLRGTLRPEEGLFERNVPGYLLTYVNGLSLLRCSLDWKAVSMPWFTNAIELNHFNNVLIEHFRGAASPSSNKLPAVTASNGKNLTTIATENIERNNVQ